MKIISITPFTKKVLSLADNSLSYGKASAKVVKDVLTVKFILKKRMFSVSLYEENEVYEVFCA